MAALPQLGNAHIDRPGAGLPSPVTIAHAPQFVYMATEVDLTPENLGKWPSERRPLTKIRPSDGCKVDGTPLAVDQWYVFHEFGCHLLLWTAPDGIKRARMRSL